MSRLTSLPIAEIDPELLAMLNADQKSERELRPFTIRAHHPELAKAHAIYGGAMKKVAVLSARLREIVRLRIAFHNQCRSCMAMRYSDGVDDGVTEDLVCSLEKPFEAPDLTDAERVALRYADLMATNHLAIDDAMYASLKKHFSEKEIVELGMVCAMCVGYGRLAATWNMIEDLPERFQEQGGKPVTPWGPDAWTTGASQGSLKAGAAGMRFDIYGRFCVDVVREDGAWVAYRVGAGTQARDRDIVIPPHLEPTEIAGLLDDIFHELGGPGDSVMLLS